MLVFFAWLLILLILRSLVVHNLQSIEVRVLVGCLGHLILAVLIKAENKDKICNNLIIY